MKHFRLAALLTLGAVAGGPAAAVDKGGCALLLLHEPGASATALSRKLAPACAVSAVEAERDLPTLWRELRRRSQELRKQGVQKVLVGGWGAAANVAMAYAAQVGEADGVLAIGPQEQAQGVGALPDLARQQRQHAPVLWVVGAEDPVGKRGEDYAYAKAPPHPFSRYVLVKTGRADITEAAVKPVIEWIKALD